MTDSSEKNLREFSRVDAVIPLDVRLILPEEKHNVRSLLVGETTLPDYQVPPEVEDVVLSEWLKLLNSKLDAIIASLASRDDRVPVISQKKVNISGGGLSFDSQEKYQPGDVLEMKMMLPISPVSILYAYGEVVDVRIIGNYYHTGVKFISIDDEIRDEIVKFVFKAQRDILRKQRR
ncbi:MAG: PilZ domain-containing protein [Dissulfurispiraceae bacterium]|jgi:hypothetical protein